MDSIYFQISEALQYAFIQRALVAGVLIALCCAFLGVFLVLRRFALIGDGLAHISFAAIALGLVLKVSPFAVSVPLVIASAFLIYKLTDRTVVYGDAAIGLLSAMGVAAGVTLASVSGGFNVDLFSYLFGSILSISGQEVMLTVALSIVVILAVGLWFHDLFALSFDNDQARAMGVPVERVNRVLLTLTALTVILGIKVAGTMLVSSLIIFPAVSALQVARSFRMAIFWAAVFAVFSVVAGILISYVFDLPAGATIVEVNGVIFLLTFGLSGSRKF